MKRLWFKRCGWLFCPVSLPGTAAFVLALLFCLQVFRAIDRHSHSATDTLFGVFPYFVCAFLLLNWLAEKTSE